MLNIFLVYTQQATKNKSFSLTFLSWWSSQGWWDGWTCSTHV